MERKYMLTDAMIPGALGLFQRDLVSRCNRDITLQNSFATQYQLSEMILTSTKVVAIDEHSNEYNLYQTEQPTQFNLQSDSLGKGFHLTRLRGLQPGNYVSIRFYLHGQDHAYRKSDRQVGQIANQKHFDFQIKDGLSIAQESELDLTLWFDFQPLQSISWTHTLKDWISRWNSLSNRYGRRLIGSMK